MHVALIHLIILTAWISENLYNEILSVSGKDKDIGFEDLSKMKLLSNTVKEMLRYSTTQSQ